MKKITYISTFFVFLLLSCTKPTTKNLPSKKTDTVYVEMPAKDSVNNELDSLGKQFNCGDLNSQTDMNNCAHNEWKYFDSIMNVKYQALLTAPDNWYAKELKASQEKWIEFRNANADIINKQYEGGTIRPFMMYLQKTSDTKDRILFLNGMMGEMGN